MRRLTSERTLPAAIVVLVLLATAISLAPAAAPAGAAQGNTAINATSARLAIGGITGPAEYDGPMLGEPTEGTEAYLDDATLYMPVAVDTSVRSADEMLRHHTVRNGDTLTGIASRYGVSMMTVWWANQLKSKDDLKVGQELIIPPINGLVVTVELGDTLDALATEHEVDAADIVAVNQLEDTNLIVGQVLVMPGAKGEPIPTPKPTPKPRVQSGGGGGGGGGGGSVPSYTGGAWAWPVIGGGNYISQYFGYGHYGLDIAADYGSTVVAARPGLVVAAGWKSNGGGYQVWVNHGGNVFTSYNHMSAVTVSVGQEVAKGQRVGRVGTSGWATGPHLHLETWVGKPWESGSYRVNPLRYY